MRSKKYPVASTFSSGMHRFKILNIQEDNIQKKISIQSEDIYIDRWHRDNTYFVSSQYGATRSRKLTWV